MFFLAREAKKGISSWTINITKTFHLTNSKNILGETFATAPGHNSEWLLKNAPISLIKNVP